MAATYPATHTVETVEITLFLLGFLNRASEVRILSGVPECSYSNYYFYRCGLVTAVWFDLGKIEAVIRTAFFFF